MILMVHSTAYFVYDSIVEYMAGSDDFLTNLHHACVLGMSFWHLMSRTSGFEYIGKKQRPLIYSNFSPTLARRGLKPLPHHAHLPQDQGWPEGNSLL
jgi:hypothetical protein